MTIIAIWHCLRRRQGRQSRSARTSPGWHRWQRAAGLAAAYNREVSSHLFPEVSAHLLAATPGRHWLEYVDWAVPLLQEPLQIADGMAIVPNRIGNGMLWDEAAVAKFKLD